MPKTKNYHSFLVESLKDPTEAAAYLSAALKEQDSQIFFIALSNVVEAYGSIAKFLEKSKPVI